MFRNLLIVVVALFYMPVTFATADENWNQFRGPRGDGTSTVKGLPIGLGESENLKWKTKIHGRAWSSPVVWGDQIWMTTATSDGKKMSGVCVDRNTGKIIHDLLIFENENPRFRHPSNSYASPTPIIEEGRVYLHFGSYGTTCLDTSTAKEIWTRRDLACDHYRAPGSSPIIDDGKLFVNYDGFDVQYVVALDTKTGKTIWKKDRTINYGTDNGDQKKAYCTNTIINFNGQKQLIAPAAVATISYSLDTGKELWKVYHGGMNAAARPLFGHGLVYLCAGNGKRHLIAVRPDGHGDVSDTHIVWAKSKTPPRRSSQLLIGDLFFMMNDAGVASCLEAKTGEIIWQQRIGGKFWASPFYADGHIYFFADDGKIPVIKASREFELVAENELDDGFNASPAVAGKTLLVRSKTHLYCFEIE